MSNAFELKCLACNDSTGVDINWGGDVLANALAHRAELEVYAKAYEAIHAGPDGYQLQGEGRLHHVAMFLGQHAGHEVIVEDEYGAKHGACSADIHCACGSRRHCTLPPGHEGEHGRPQAKTARP